MFIIERPGVCKVPKQVVEIVSEVLGLLLVIPLIDLHGTGVPWIDTSPQDPTIRLIMNKVAFTTSDSDHPRSVIEYRFDYSLDAIA